jgi:hypothetical protein
MISEKSRNGYPCHGANRAPDLGERIAWRPPDLNKLPEGCHRELLPRAALNAPKGVKTSGLGLGLLGRVPGYVLMFCVYI